ncbi:MAG: flagellar basal body P-ring formation protein FlgA [Alphaproteobacteria bacterium]|nr:flagellar basal body P-ring formation protein FlgA [Alphaproteobacteria bacterium]
MIRSALLAMTLLAPASLASAPALAGEMVLLRESLSVDGAQITLGDLFEQAGEAADVAIARSPAPGRRTSLDVHYVRRLAAEHDLDWANAGGLRRVTITRNSRVITHSDLADIIAGELFMTEGRSHEVRLSTAAATLHAPVDSFGGLEIQTLNFDPRTGMLGVEVVPYDGADTVRLSGRAFATTEVPVLAHPVAQGEEIGSDDIAWISVRADRVRPDAVLDPNDLVGMQARRALRPNEALRSYDFQAPVVISRGELVSLTFEAPGLQLAVRARALEDAADGELARFVNLQSNRTIEALVDGPGRARVGVSAASF